MMARHTGDDKGDEEYNYREPICNDSINGPRSASRTSMTLVSNMSCLAPAPQSSAACWNARPNLLHPLAQSQCRSDPPRSMNPISVCGLPTYFFRTSPNSKAPVTPTTKYVFFSSFKQVTTNGRLFVCLPFFASFSAHLSRVASTSHNASRESVDG